MTNDLLAFIRDREADRLRLQWLRAVHEDHWTGTSEESYQAWLRTLAGSGENLYTAMRLLGWSWLSLCPPLFRSLAASQYGAHSDFKRKLK